MVPGLAGGSPLRDRVELGLRAFARHAGRQPRHDVQPRQVPADEDFFRGVLGQRLSTIAIGTQRSGRKSRLTPEKEGSATPTIVNGWPFRRIVSPTVSGAAPNRFRHSRWLMTATGWAPGTRSSAGESSRPRAGRAPSSSKKLPLPAPRSLAPRSPRSRSRCETPRLRRTPRCRRKTSRRRDSPRRRGRRSSNSMPSMLVA